MKQFLNTRTPEQIKHNHGWLNIGKFVRELSPSWKGNSVGYRALHCRIKRLLIKPCICSCLKRPPVDLHNIDGRYNEDLSKWVWLCRSCHSKAHRPVGYKNMNVLGKKHYKLIKK